MAARKSLITRVVSHFQQTALREVVFSGHLEPREGGGLDGCQMQPGIAADHRQETRNLSIFCIVFDRLQFSNTTKGSSQKNPDIFRSGLGLGLGLLGQKITRINILSLPFKGVDIKLG